MTSPKLPLADWGDLRRDLVWIRRAVIEDAYRNRRYEPAGRIVAWRLLGGGIRFRLSSGRFEVNAGQWVLPGAGTGTRVFAEGTEFVSVRFHAHWPGGVSLFDHERPLVIDAAKAGALDEAAFALIDFQGAHLGRPGLPLQSQPVDLARHIGLRALHDRWFLAYAALMSAQGREQRPPPRLDIRMQAAVQLMESRLRLGEVLTEQAVAEGVGLSLSQFKRLFARDLGVTPKRWLDDLRFALARDRLNEGGRTVKQIGYELGFRSPNHFSAWFARRRGCPPGQSVRAAR